MHVQHLLGIGHQRRAAVISRALQAAGAKVIYVSGGLPVLGLDVGAAQHVQLAPARAADVSYAGLVDVNGRPVCGRWQADRAAHLLAVFRRHQPDVLLLETFPFGRKLLGFEILPLLEAAAVARPKPQVVCSVRDILEPRAKLSRYRQMRDQALQFFDLILVHSDPAVIPFHASFPLAGELAPRVLHTGFVAELPPRLGLRTPDGRSEVIVSAGGGAVGHGLLQNALGAHALLAPKSGHVSWGRTWRLLTGTAHTRGRWQAPVTDLPPGIEKQSNRSDFPALLSRCRVSVSQAGYNTLLEIVRARCRAVVVPFADGGQREQSMRARLFASHGLVRTLEAGALTPYRLAREIRSIAGAPRPRAGAVDLDGAVSAARAIMSLKASST